MSMVERLTGRKAQYRNVPVRLTSLGQEKVEKMSGSGTDVDVMYYLADNGPSNTAEISRGIRKHPKQVERAVKRLSGMGYVQYARIDS